MRCDDGQSVFITLTKTPVHFFDCVLEVALVRTEAGKIAQLDIHHERFIHNTGAFSSVLREFRSGVAGLVYLPSRQQTHPPRAAANLTAVTLCRIRTFQSEILSLII